jgi:glycosyltransferase involved in cell wall biosynthesis
MKILFVGPISPPIHGQSLAFTRFYESIDNNNKLLINTNITTNKALNTVKNLFLIFSKLFFHKIDTVYFTCSRSISGSIKDIVLITLASFKGIRLINHLHGSDFYEFLHRAPAWYQHLLINAYNKVDTSIVLLDEMREQFKDFPKMNIVVVSNFYDEELDTALASKNTSHINMLYLSNIIKSKGIFELINAFDVLTKTYDNIVLNIAGTFMADIYMSKDEVEQQFLQQIKNNPKLNYLGQVQGKNKIELLQRSDIFILPSYYPSEAFPISIIEAMRSGNAIITTDYKYLPSIVRPENGALVEIKSVSSLIIGLENLLQDPIRLHTIQEHNIKIAKKYYTLTHYLDQLKKIVLETT